MTLPTPSSCCDPCPDSQVVNIPGAPGTDGADGAAGAVGANAYSQLVDGFNMPAFGADTPSLLATSSAWMVLNQIVRVQVAGDMRVISKADATHVVLRNVATASTYPDNVAPASGIAPSMFVSPSGLQGPSGAAGSTVVFPTTTKGDLIVDNGALSPAPSVARMGAGTNGQVVAYDSAAVLGVNKVTIAPNTALDNAIARFDGAAGLPVPVQNSAMLVTDSGDLQISTGNAKGANATDLQSQRAAADQVASGARAVVSGGSKNKSSGADAAIGGGEENIASGNWSSVGGGRGNQATVEGATVPGGQFNSVSGVNAFAAGYGCGAVGAYSVVTGRYGFSAATGQRVHAAGRFADTGDCQNVDHFLFNSTTNATPTALFLDGAAAPLTPGANLTMGFQGTVVGRRDNGDSAMWTFTGLLREEAGLVLVAAVVPALVAASAGCAATWGQAANVTVTVVGANLVVTVTGAAANNIRWQCILTPGNSVTY